MFSLGMLLLATGLVAAAPSKRAFYTYMPNNTCVTAPSVPLDSNWAPNAPVTSNIVGGQPGVSMLLDIGVMDTRTCKAIPNILVEVWGPNAVGEYGDFLRGATPTGSVGIAEFNTIFPGHTSTGANHVNVIVHNPGATTTEGATSAAFIGEIFFPDSWTNVINAWQMYATNKNSLMSNENDPMFKAASAGGMYPVADPEDIQDDWPEGIVSYITIGIDPSATPLSLN